MIDATVSDDVCLALGATAAMSSSVVGAKAAQLGRLLQAGILVPQGYVLPFSALRSALDRSQLLDRLSVVVAQIPLTSDADLDACSSAAQAIIASAPEAVDFSSFAFCDGSAPLVVRSSAHAEDSSRSSAAGQFATLLNVIGHESLSAAVCTVWSSLYSTHAVRYQIARKIELWPPRMGVIVQQQVASRVAGVVFTAHPVLGEEWLVIESTYGFGDLLVSGAVTPDRVEIHRRTGNQVISIGSKRTYSTVSSMTLTTKDTPHDAQSRLSLQPSEITEVVSLAVAVEALFGTPQDIEFAFDEERLYVLQARPITT